MSVAEQVTKQIKEVAQKIKELITDHPELSENYGNWKNIVSTLNPTELKKQTIEVLTRITEVARSPEFVETIKNFIVVVKDRKAEIIHKIINRLIQDEDDE